jgi:hypothetical protein
MRQLVSVWVFAMLLLGCSRLMGQCNGDPLLCSKRYDEVCYVTTHNAFNYEAGFLFPNQTHPVAQQLTDGVRGLMLDVYWQNNQPTCYHGSNFLGSEPLASILGDVKAFLDAHPTEVVTIIFESYVTAAQMNDVFTQVGLLDDVYAQTLGQPWPTLGDLIAADRRLVVFTDVNDGQAFPWYHYVWDHAVETNWSNHSRADFSCGYNRGDSANALLILNHFVSEQTLGIGIKDSAAVINANPYCVGRAMNCWGATGKIPNFLTVDFYEVGDVVAAKDQLNTGFVGTAPVLSGRSSVAVTVSPNPVVEEVVLHWEGQGRMEGVLGLYDLQGRLRMQVPILFAGQDVRLALPEAIRDGVYLWKWDSKAGAAIGRMMVVR